MRQDSATRSVKQFEIHDEAIRISSAVHTRSFQHAAQSKLVCSPYTVISVQTTEQEALNPVVLFTYTFILSSIHTVIPSLSPYSHYFYYPSLSLQHPYLPLIVILLLFHFYSLFMLFSILFLLFIVSVSYYLPLHYIILLTQPPCIQRILLFIRRIPSHVRAGTA